MNKEVKITAMDNGYLLKVIDLDSDGRVPIAKYVAKDFMEIKVLLQTIFIPTNKA